MSMTKTDEVSAGAAALLDVRTQEEWDEGHAAHAIHVPVDTLVSGELGGLTPAKKVYVYCKGGVRAQRAVDYLNSRGYQAENAGGLTDWLSAGGVLAAD